jgi:hypothetical protein
VPRVSPWFTFFDYVQGTDQQLLQWYDTPEFQQDLFGLKTLNDTGRLDMQHIPCMHQDIPRASCKHYYDLYTKPLLDN